MRQVSDDFFRWIVVTVTLSWCAIVLLVLAFYVSVLLVGALFRG